MDNRWPQPEIRRWTVKVHDAVIQVEITIDWASLAYDLGDRCIRSKSGKAVEMGGVIKARKISLS